MVGIASKGSQHGLRMGKQQEPSSLWHREQVLWQQGWGETREQRLPARWTAAWRGGSSEAMAVGGPTAPGASWVLMGGEVLLGKHTVTAQPLPKGRKAKSRPQHLEWRDTGHSRGTSRTVGDGDIAAWSDLTVSTAAR